MFLDRWAPDDAPAFTTEFIDIIRRCHAEATEPFVRQFALAIAATPLQPFVVSGSAAEKQGEKP
jgi:hypothetical protein